jgi:hypothetical protein
VGELGGEELENLSFFFFPSFFSQQLNPTFVVLKTKVVKQNPTLQEGGEEREREIGGRNKTNNNPRGRVRVLVGVAKDKDMKDLSFLQILTTLQARGREREREGLRRGQ